MHARTKKPWRKPKLTRIPADTATPDLEKLEPDAQRQALIELYNRFRGCRTEEEISEATASLVEK